jgi:hypothetical protein
MRPGHQLLARVRLTDARGNPVCARLRPPAITWSARPGWRRRRGGLAAAAAGRASGGAGAGSAAALFSPLRRRVQNGQNQAW